MKANWFERFLVNWAAFVMDNVQFNAFLDKYGLDIDERFEIVRKRV